MSILPGRTPGRRFAAIFVPTGSNPAPIRGQARCPTVGVAQKHIRAELCEQDYKDVIAWPPGKTNPVPVLLVRTNTYGAQAPGHPGRPSALLSTED
jgi:hypothetical protein